MKKNIAILFGGNSAEHEVSIITGLQVLEAINKDRYAPFPIFLTKKGQFKLFNIVNRKSFSRNGGQPIILGKDKNRPFIKPDSIFSKKTYLNSAYLAFHGGDGEGGQLQGFCETLHLPYTSPNVESSSMAMNKQVTKEILASHKIETVEGIAITDREINKNVNLMVKQIKTSLKLPLVVKPAHLGSSIGVKIAKTDIELKKALLEASMMDSEIVVEKLMKNFKEYNCSIRVVEGNLQASEIERPLPKDEILSFADKYKRGGKKSSGMASLNRELPAKISKDLKNKLTEKSKEVYKALRCKGLVRIDLMVVGKSIYVTEVNPIPGSMSFCLWEASGVSFRDQITQSIEESIRDHINARSKDLDHESDIVDNFIKSSNNKDH